MTPKQKKTRTSDKSSKKTTHSGSKSENAGRHRRPKRAGKNQNNIEYERLRGNQREPETTRGNQREAEGAKEDNIEKHSGVILFSSL